MLSNAFIYSNTNAYVIITDTSDEGTGTFEGIPGYMQLYVGYGGSSNGNSTLEIAGGNIKTNVLRLTSGTLKISGGTFDEYGLSVYGGNSDNSNIEITGGKFPRLYLEYYNITQCIPENCLAFYEDGSVVDTSSNEIYDFYVAEHRECDFSEYDYDENSHWQICKMCKKVNSAATPEAHDPTDADCENASFCTVCDFEFSPKLGHDYVDDVCTACGKAAPYKTVSQNNYESLGLDESYIGYVYIADADALFAFAEAVNSGETEINAVLVADIDLNPGLILSYDFYYNEFVVEGEGELVEWTPIGIVDYYNDIFVRYNGTFDGNGYTIRGLYTEDWSDLISVGLFAGASHESVIKNVTVENSVILGYYAAGIASECYGVIENCHFDGVIWGDSYIGGIVGYASGATITQCTSSGFVVGDSYYVGGIVGSTEHSKIINCLNSSEVFSFESCVGGIVGIAYGVYVNSCLNVGIVYSYDDYCDVVGYSEISEISNCYYLEYEDSWDYYATAVTEEQFESGEVAYLLRSGASEVDENGNVLQIWGQNIDNGEENDIIPTFGGAPVYYGYLTCDDDAEKVYTNNENASEDVIEHDWDEGVVTDKPTCTEEGELTHTCNNDCTHTYTESIDPTGHDWVEVTDLYKVCNSCGADECDHMCHKGGVYAIIWDVFDKIYDYFGIETECDCGEKH